MLIYLDGNILSNEVLCLVAQSCPTFCDPMDCNPPGSFVHGILKERILEGVAMPSSRESSPHKDWTMCLMPPALASRFFTTSAIWEAPFTVQKIYNLVQYHLFILILLHVFMESCKPYIIAKTNAKNYFFFSFIFISWRLISLQHCSGFCHTLKWISHRFTCIPHPGPPSHCPLHLIPLGLPSAPGQSTCLMHTTWAGDLFHPR